LTLAECLRLDYVLCQHFVAGHGDFFEGVRSVLIDKGAAPVWKYGAVAEVGGRGLEGRRAGSVEACSALEAEALLPRASSSSLA
jgi:hypothetical protein